MRPFSYKVFNYNYGVTNLTVNSTFIVGAAVTVATTVISFAALVVSVTTPVAGFTLKPVTGAFSANRSLSASSQQRPRPFSV